MRVTVVQNLFSAALAFSVHQHLGLQIVKLEFVFDPRQCINRLCVSPEAMMCPAIIIDLRYSNEMPAGHRPQPGVTTRTVYGFVLTTLNGYLVSAHITHETW